MGTKTHQYPSNGGLKQEFMPRQSKEQEMRKWIKGCRLFIFSVTLKRSGVVLKKVVMARTQEIAENSLYNSETMGEIEVLTLIERYDSVQAAV